MRFTNTTIGNIASVQTGPFGSQLHNEDYVLVGTPIVTVEHLGQRKMTQQNLPCVSDADKERLSKYTLEYGDLVFSRVGSVDRCSWVGHEEDGWMFSGRCLRVRPIDKETVYHKYLYYFFTLEDTKDFVRNIAVGATMPSINTRLLSEVPIQIPSIGDQKAIADTLSALDDRIEENMKINHHLAGRPATDSSPDMRRGKRVSRRAARCSDSRMFASYCSISKPTNSSNSQSVSLSGRITGVFFKSVCVIRGCVEPRFIL
jgi:type I restriction enzyme S subunit